ncbi:LytTR family DNA-binding domain-containing protein [Oscillospiraceae bacterium PP1C4]
MINIILCDDNTVLLEKYKKVLNQLAEKYCYDISITTFFSGEQLLFHLSENPNEASIIYLDILMLDLNGIDTAKRLRQIGCHSEIIFLTSCKDFVFESFDAYPLHYIVKDSKSEREKLEQAFLKSIKLTLEKEKELFLCSRGRQKKKIPLHKISYFEIHGRIVAVHYEGKSFDFYSNMDTLQVDLNEKFFIRCHRSFLVNLKFIDTINKDNLLLSSGDVIPLGSTYAKDVKRSFASCLSGFCS